MTTKSATESGATQMPKCESDQEAAQKGLFLIKDMGAASRETKGAFGLFSEGTPPPFNGVPLG